VSRSTNPSIAVLVVVVGVLAACGGPTPSPRPSSSLPVATVEPTPVASPTVTAGAADTFARDGRFQLLLSLPASTFRASEPITGEGVLTTLDGREAGIAGSGAGVIGFTFREIGGTRSMGGLMTADCAPHTIPAGGDLRATLRPSAGWSAEDPNADFYRAFSEASEVRLPAGTWEIAAHAIFMGPGCTQPERNLVAATMVEVTP
jgi:hypothetical protein